MQGASQSRWERLWQSIGPNRATWTCFMQFLMFLQRSPLLRTHISLESTLNVSAQTICSFTTLTETNAREQFSHAPFSSLGIYT